MGVTLTTVADGDAVVAVTRNAETTVELEDEDDEPLDETLASTEPGVEPTTDGGEG